MICGFCCKSLGDGRFVVLRSVKVKGILYQDFFVCKSCYDEQLKVGKKWEKIKTKKELK